ncbi:unnamed protein product [Urochloa decumbens]|uniref:Uncharacterized protein n=1 Tax=Urochloa decumbens TaxID=240449 RepID=A0ABC8YTR1_9POAL
MEIPVKCLPSMDLPKKLNLSWVPAGMDRSSACRVAVQIPAYVELPCEEYHVTSNIKLIIDKDTTNWVDFLAELDAEVKHGKRQELHVSFWDKARNEYHNTAASSTYTGPKQ